MWKRRRRNKLRSTPLPEIWREVPQQYCRFYPQLSKQDQREIEGHIQVLIAEKNFEGCAGLDVTEDMKLRIASQACLLLLHRKTDYFPTLRSIIVYPHRFQSTFTRDITSGVVEEYSRTLAGASWESGAVVLAWDEICRDAEPAHVGYDVVLHEFAHQLDFEDGWLNGAPYLGRKKSYAVWAQTMSEAFQQFQLKVRNGESDVLNPYGASSPSEFFAVATEAFFCLPRPLQEKHPRLYDELRRYYQQDPAQWCPPQSAASK